MPTLIRRTVRTNDADNPVPPSELGVLAQMQQEAIDNSPFLSKFTDQVKHLDRLETCRQQLDPKNINSKVNELIRARARQMTGEQMADSMLDAMASICAPEKDRNPDDEPTSRQKLMEQFGDLTDRETADKAMEQLEVMFNRGRKAAIELATREIPKLQDEPLSLAKEAVEMFFAVNEDSPDDIPQDTSGDGTESPIIPIDFDADPDPKFVPPKVTTEQILANRARLEEIERMAARKISEEHIPEVDIEEEDAPDPDMADLLSSLPVGIEDDEDPEEDEPLDPDMIALLSSLPVDI